jgi:hypothetical protein
VARDGRRGARRLVAKSEKFSNGRIVLSNAKENRCIDPSKKKEKERNRRFEFD